MLRILFLSAQKTWHSQCKELGVHARLMVSCVPYFYALFQEALVNP
nr:MAG TPA: hypothetical protein [Caudoviricetes sp.]